MARIRTIKPEFWTSPTIVDLQPFARLLFIGVWNFADDWGLVPDDPRRLKMQVLPVDDVDADSLIDSLVEVGLLTRVEAPNGQKLLWVNSFGEHQRIDKRTAGKWGNPAEWVPKESKEPENPTPSPQPPEDPHDSHPTPSDPVTGKEWKGKENPPKPPQGGDGVETVDEELRAYGLGPPPDDPVTKARRKVNAA